MNDTNPSKIRAALAGGRSWPRMKRAIAALSDDDLGEAERLERLGQRRENTLMALKAERQRRLGKPERMLRLKSEATR